MVPVQFQFNGVNSEELDKFAGQDKESYQYNIQEEIFKEVQVDFKHGKA